jgi:hypothetical protein
MTPEQFLQKLQGLNLTINNNNDSLSSDDGWKLSWNFKFSYGKTDFESVQLILGVFYNDAVVTSWGCMAEDQHIFVKFIVEAQNKARELHYSSNAQQGKVGKALFSAL